MYENDQRKKIDTLGDFDNKTPTHMAATHAISKSKRNFQNRIPRELDKNFYIPRISMIHWISSNLLKLKNRQQKKVISIPNPGIQPKYSWRKSSNSRFKKHWYFSKGKYIGLILQRPFIYVENVAFIVPLYFAVTVSWL